MLKSTAKPATVKRRQYHREYHKTKFGHRWIKCPTCEGNMRVGEGIENCANCRYKYDRWDKCDCGNKKLRVSALCHSCAGLRGGRPGRSKKRKGPIPNPFCPNTDEGNKYCGSQFPHGHCACGLVIKPSEVVCQLCIFEQPRVERVMAGKRFKGEGLEDAA